MSPDERGGGQNVDEASPLLAAGEAKPPAEELLGERWRLAASSAGFFADAYDLFTIDLVLLILELEYGKDSINADSKTLMVTTMLAGIVVGQLSFGFVADWLGRKWTFVGTAALTVLGAILSACTVSTGGSGFDLPLQLALCRLILGIGVGGEYPLSATVTAESAETPEVRGFNLALVISMQGWGMLFSCLLVLVAIPLKCKMEVLWRLLLAFGALPSFLAFFLRWSLHESKAYVAARQVDRERASPWEQASNSALIIRAHWRSLLGTASTWFLMNFSLYSLGSFKSQVLHEISLTKAKTADLADSAEVLQSAQFAAITSVFSIVGFTAALLLIDKMSRFWMQCQGFLMLVLMFAILAVLGERSSPPIWVYLLLLGMIFFWQNLGPNTTTFVVPAEAFPTLVRATCHGVSAACGKLGALTGTAAFPHAKAAFGMQAVYAACAGVALLGAVMTYLFTPRKAAEFSVESQGDTKTD